MVEQKIFQIQSKMPKIEKDTKNDFFKSKYATLQQILGAALPLFKEHQVFFNTRILIEHPDVLAVSLTDIEDGTSMHTFVKLLNIGDMQKLGSAMTYATRYGLLGLLGLAPDIDTDGNDIQITVDTVKELLKTVKVPDNMVKEIEVVIKDADHDRLVKLHQYLGKCEKK